MIRLACLGDSHFDHRGHLQDVIDVHDALLKVAAAREVHGFVHGGDWFERASTPVERNAVADWIRKATAIGPVFGVKGNHDAAQDLEIFNKLETEHSVRIVEQPGAYPIHTVAGPITMIAVPWFDRAHIASQLEPGERTRELTISAARAMLDGLRHEAQAARARGTKATVFVGHVMVGGSEVSSGQRIIGTTVELAPSDIAGVGCSVAALGHVHLHQRWLGGRVFYPGSPHRCDYGEAREPKGCCLVTLDDDGKFLSNEFIELPARRMVLIEEDHSGKVGPHILQAPERIEDIRGALVRYRYRVRAEDLHLISAEQLERRFLEAGAAEVQLEAIVETETRTRAPEIVEARTTQAKVEAYLTAKQIPTDEAQRSRLFSKLGELEAGA